MAEERNAAGRLLLRLALLLPERGSVTL